MTTVGQRDDMVSDLMNKIVDWAAERPERFKYPEDAVMRALRSFAIQYNIKLEG